MGFRFHKSLPINKLLRINLSKSGPSLGIGPKGANLNLSSRGVKGSVGLPGSGMSYRKQRSWASGGSLLFYILIGAIILAALFWDKA